MPVIRQKAPIRTNLAMNKLSKLLTVGITFIVALILMLIPLPDWARAYRPEWLALVLIYWNLALPKNVGINIAWILGLCVDVIQGTLLGQHALGLAITAYLALRLYPRARNYPLHQQALLVGIILLPYAGISLWISGIIGENPKPWLYLAPVATSALIWPLVYLVLRAIRRAALIQ